MAEWTTVRYEWRSGAVFESRKRRYIINTNTDNIQSFWERGSWASTCLTWCWLRIQRFCKESWETFPGGSPRSSTSKNKKIWAPLIPVLIRHLKIATAVLGDLHARPWRRPLPWIYTSFPHQNQHITMDISNILILVPSFLCTNSTWILVIDFNNSVDPLKQGLQTGQSCDSRWAIVLHSYSTLCYVISPCNNTPVSENSNSSPDTAVVVGDADRSWCFRLQCCAAAPMNSVTCGICEMRGSFSPSQIPLRLSHRSFVHLSNLCVLWGNCLLSFACEHEGWRTSPNETDGLDNTAKCSSFSPCASPPAVPSSQVCSHPHPPAAIWAGSPLPSASTSQNGISLTDLPSSDALPVF